MEYYTFYSCNKLKSIDLPDQLTTIPQYAFNGCSSLGEIYIPAGITTVVKQAFTSCNSLKYVYFEGIQEQWNSISVGESNDTLLNATVFFNTCSHPHQWKDATCTTDAQETAECDICKETDTRTVENSAFGHTEVIDEAVEPTYTTTGLTEGKHCSVCNEVLIKQEILDKIPYPEGGIAQINDTIYFSLSDALYEAKAIGGTVTLLTDCEAEDVIVKGDVTLDLNGYTLTAEYVATFNNSNIIDNSEDKTGLLVVDTDNVSFAHNNTQMPVYNGEGYMFDAPTIGHGIGNVTSDGFTYAFLPKFNSKIIELFKDNAASDHALSFIVEIFWTDDNGTTRSQQFKYSDEGIAKWYTSGSTFGLKITGLGSLVDKEISITLKLVSDLGVMVEKAPYKTVTLATE